MTLAAQHTANLTMPAVDQGAILRHLGINASDPAAQALILVCQRYDLDPILKHALLIQGRLYVTRDGLLHVAHRSGKFDGMEVVEQGENATHFTAKVSVYRKDMGRPFTYIGRHPKSGRGPGAQYGPEMAVKVAEVMALRRAFDVALGAAEERWDDEAQREMQQADNAAPVQVEKAAPAPDNHILSDAEVARDRVEVMARRVASVAGQAAVADELNQHNLTTKEGCVEAYTALVALGKKAAEPKPEPAPTESVGSDTPETMATNEQIKSLQAIARTAGATTSDQRAVLWGHSLSHGSPIHTKELNDAQAAGLLGMFDGLGVDERKQLFEEAKRELLGGGA